MGRGRWTQCGQANTQTWARQTWIGWWTQAEQGEQTWLKRAGGAHHWKAAIAASLVLSLVWFDKGGNGEVVQGDSRLSLACSSLENGEKC